MSVRSVILTLSLLKGKIKMKTQKTGIALATQLADAGKDAMFDFDAMMLAKEIMELAPSDEMSSLLFKFAGTISAGTATRITSLLMTESDFNAMVSEIEMFDEIEKEVLGE